jgi:sugar phosphate isomerase/epimerase
MTIRFYKALWGMSGTYGEQMERIAAAGYEGFEAPVTDQNADALREAAHYNGLGLVAMLFVEQAQELERGIAAAQSAGAELVNVHSGRDWWEFDQGCRFFEEALDIGAASGTRVVHETHRGRLLFHPAITARYLNKFPELELTADFSHWTCVCESMLQDQEEAVRLAARRTAHLHARVGHEQGPQVPDPRAPEWATYLERFESWWDMVILANETRDEAVLRVDPEFGPPHYMQTLPYTAQPVADLWDVCLDMTDRLRERWTS